MLYVLVGGPCQILDTPHKFEVWGQPVEVTESLATSAILAGAPLLPKDQFDVFGFTKEEIAAYPNANVQMKAPADWQAKHALALEAAREYRANLVNPPAPKAAPAKAAPAKSDKGVA